MATEKELIEIIKALCACIEEINNQRTPEGKTIAFSVAFSLIDYVKKEIIK